MTSSKKVRCTCVRCGKINYLPAVGTDISEKFLCERCDDLFISFINKDCPEGGFVHGDPLERFLKVRRKV